jgi:outer membrane protein OmpA-like peptidoglycan-associated protein
MLLHIISWLTCSILFYGLCCKYTVKAQNPAPLWYAGGYAGLQYNMHSTAFSTLPGVPGCCPGYSSGNGTGFTAGLLAEFPLIPGLELTIRAGLSSLNGMPLATENIGNRFVRSSIPPFDTIIRPITVEHSLNASLTMLALEPAAAYTIFPGMRIYGGLAAGLLVSASYQQKETLISPDNITFTDGRKVRNESAGSIPTLQSFQLFGLIGAGYSLPISNSSWLEPALRYYQPFTSITSESWTVSALQASISYKMAIMPVPEKVIPPLPIQPILRDTVFRRDTGIVSVAGLAREQVYRVRSSQTIEQIQENGIQINRVNIIEQYMREIPSTKPAALLALQLNASGIDTSGRIIPNPLVRIEEWETEESFPLLPYVYFDEGDAKLEKTAQKMLGLAQIQRFNEDSLPSSTLDIYRDMINIIGSRLKKNQAIIEITGTNNTLNEEKKAGLSEQRALAVKDYLQKTWGIPSARIKIAARALPEQPANNTYADGQTENRRAEISSPAYSVMQPVFKKTTEITANPPIIEIQPGIQSNNGLQSWQINLSQGGRILQTYSGTDSLPRQALRWSLYSTPLSPGDEPLIIDFTATDTNGRKEAVRQELKVEQITLRKKRQELKNDMRIERFSLLLFDFNSAILDKSNKQLLNQIRERIQPASRVTIAGYADRTGEASYNQELARKRCREVQNYLGLPDNRTKLLPYGSTEFLFENDTPQGRSYSRTVRITIETPVR